MIPIDSIWNGSFPAFPLMPVKKGALSVQFVGRPPKDGRYVLTSDESVQYERAGSVRTQAQIVGLRNLGARGFRMDRPAAHDFCQNARLVAVPIRENVVLDAATGYNATFCDGVTLKAPIFASGYPHDFIRLDCCSQVRMYHVKLLDGPTEPIHDGTARSATFFYCDDVELADWEAVTGKHLISISGCSRFVTRRVRAKDFTDHFITYKGWGSEDCLSEDCEGNSIAIGNPSYAGDNAVLRRCAVTNGFAVNSGSTARLEACQAPYLVTQPGAEALVVDSILDMPEDFPLEYDPLMSLGKTTLRDSTIYQRKMAGGRRCYRGNVILEGTNRFFPANGIITDPA